jgi:hypothetical protein
MKKGCEKIVEHCKASLEALHLMADGSLHPWPKKAKTLVDAIRSGVEDEFYTLEEIGTSEKELEEFLKKIS